MKKNKANYVNKSVKPGALDYPALFKSIEGVSHVNTVDALKPGEWGEYKFSYNDADFYFSIIESRSFNTFRLANFFDFSEHLDKLKGDLNSLVYNFNTKSVGFKCYRVSDRLNVAVFCSEFLFMDNVITKDNIKANLALLSAFPESFLKVDEK
ncbi:hypothetical protein [Cronobacter malonaticus]|uniref:hypothetical protein n=1 Tax=Cronobacter malonaticus TaxID=413503 RepID=UPI0009490AEB|nr:hypothetical protein [Cronobacter malonaticus]PUX15719.1 hypothetical protein BS413_18020 [Cronobacter malonaticus]